MWWALYEIATGRLRSTTSRRPGKLPPGIGSVEFQEQIDMATHVWDTVQLTFVLRPVPMLRDRIDDFEASGLWPIDPALRARLRFILEQLLPRTVRYYRG